MTKGGKKKKQVLKFTLDCTHPVEDGIMDAANFVSVHSFSDAWCTQNWISPIRLPDWKAILGVVYFFKVALNKNSFHLLLNACYRSYCKYFILVSFISFLACSCISIWSNRHVCVSLFRNSSFRSASKWMVKLVTWVVAWSPSKGARAKSQWHQRSPSLKGKSEIRDSFSWSWMLMKGW